MPRTRMMGIALAEVLPMPRKGFISEQPRAIRPAQP
jgi:hypothetical protein